MLQVLMAAGSLTLGAIAYFFIELARERRLESRSHYRPPLSPALDDGSDDSKATKVREAIDSAKGANSAATAEWVDEKLEEGWTESDVQKFLTERPLLDLN